METERLLLETDFPEGDYISPGLVMIRLDDAFPHMKLGDVSLSTWPYLRREIRHNWYVDDRNPTVGFLSRDEAAILYNSALLFKGKPCLEIGCWRGWSTAHIAAASGGLDVIDPVLQDDSFFSDIKSSLARAGVLDSITFHPGFSPPEVEYVSQSGAKRWSFIFIDGDHEGIAPRLDAEVVARNAAETAMVLFHDLNSPDVAAGLDYLRSQGWNTLVYQTMQIMGVAWRGDVKPVQHVPDPKQFWPFPAHLAQYVVSNQGPSGQAVEIPENQTELEALFTGMRKQLPKLTARLTYLEGVRERLSREFLEVREAQRNGAATAERLSIENDLLVSLLQKRQREFSDAAEKLANAEDQLGILEQKASSIDVLVSQRDNLASALDRLQAKHVALIDQLSDLHKISQPAPTPGTFGIPERLRTSQAATQELLTELRTLQGNLESGMALAQLLGSFRVILGLCRRRWIGGQEQTRAQAEFICTALAVRLSPDSKQAFTVWLSQHRVLLALLRRMFLGRRLEVQSLVFWRLIELIRNDQSTAMLKLEALVSRSYPQNETSDESERAALLEEIHALKELHRHDLMRLEDLAAAKVGDETAILEAEIELATLRSRITGDLPQSDDLISR